MSRAIQRVTLFMSFAVIMFLTLGFTAPGQSLRHSYGPSFPSSSSFPSFVHSSSNSNSNSSSGGGGVVGSAKENVMDAEKKAELGRHAWYLFHTVLASYPETPTPSEKDDLETWMRVFTSLYPCKSCSAHFKDLLKKYPVQTSSRTAAAMWGCSIHNQVNKDLGKQQHDCSTILEDYDCGCGTPATK